MKKVTDLQGKGNLMQGRNQATSAKEACLHKPALQIQRLGGEGYALLKRKKGVGAKGR